MPCCGQVYCDEECQKNGAATHEKFCGLYRSRRELLQMNVHLNLADIYLSGAPVVAEGLVREMESPLHGKGIFAVAPIKAGQPISYCPFDGMFGVHSLTSEGAPNMTVAEASDYRFEVVFRGVKRDPKNPTTMGAFSNPHTRFRKHFLAHVANDAACLQVPRPVADEFAKILKVAGADMPTQPVPEGMIAAVLDYWSRSVENCNCGLSLNQNTVALFALKDIEASPKSPVELTVSYSFGYWVQKAVPNLRMNTHFFRWFLNSISCSKNSGKYLMTFISLLKETRAQEHRTTKYMAAAPKIDGDTHDRLLLEMMDGLEQLRVWLRASKDLSSEELENLAAAASAINDASSAAQ